MTHGRIQQAVKTSTIVAIVLRLFAIYWAATGIIVAVSLLGIGLSTTPLAEVVAYQWFQMLAAPVWYLLLACGAWFFASSIAKRVVPAADAEIGCIEIKARDLYGFGLLLIGVFTFLSYLGPAFSVICRVILDRSGDALAQGQNGRAVFDLGKEVIPCVVGALIACASPKLGARLAITPRER